MARTTGKCTQPYKKRGRPKKADDGATKGKPKYSDRHKKREQAEKERIEGLEEGKRYIGNIPSYYEMSKLGVFDDEEKAISYLMAKGVIDVPNECYRCSSAIPKRDRHRVRCQKVNCQWTPPAKCDSCQSDMLKPHPEEDQANCVRHCSNMEECGWTWKPGKVFQRCFFHGSLFYDSGLATNRILHLLWLWLHRVPSTTAAKMVGVEKETSGRWYRHLRQLVVEMLLSRGYYESQVGGENVIVEIDESKFGKRKYNRGRRVKGDWVLGMVERTQQRRMVLVVVPNRTAETLEAIIDRFVAPGSIIHSDMWKGYDKLKEMDGKKFDHRRLCHKYEFVSKDGIHTQTIEGNWTAVKRTVPVSMRNGHDLQEFLFEFMWRRQHASDLWEGLMEGLSRVRYTPKMLKLAQEERDIKCEDEDDTWELPRNCRPRDVRLDVDEDSDGEMRSGDGEVIAAGVLQALLQEAQSPPGARGDGHENPVI